MTDIKDTTAVKILAERPNRVRIDGDESHESCYIYYNPQWGYTVDAGSLSKKMVLQMLTQLLTHMRDGQFGNPNTPTPPFPFIDRVIVAWKILRMGR